MKYPAIDTVAMAPSSSRWDTGPISLAEKWVHLVLVGALTRPLFRPP